MFSFWDDDEDDDGDHYGVAVAGPGLNYLRKLLTLRERD